MSGLLSGQAVQSKWSQLRRHRFLGHVAALMTGSVIAQAVPILLSPVLTRLYTPGDFAAFALFMSVTAVISVVAAGRYDQAILLPAEDEDALNLVALCWLILSSLCLLLSLIIGVFYGSLPAEWLAALHGEWLYLLPPAVFATTSFQILSVWNNRCARFPQLAMSRATQGSASGFAQCGLGYGAWHSAGLIWGQVVGLCAGLLMLLRYNWQSLQSGRAQLGRQRMVSNAYEYRRFPLLSTWGSLFDSGAFLMVLLVISHSFTSNITGFFSFTQRVLSVPLFLISSAIAQVLHQRIAKMNNEDWQSILPYVLRAALFLSAIAVPFVVLLALFGVDLFSFAFGKDWAEAGRYAGLLSVAVGIRFIVSPLTVVLSLNHNVKSCVQWQVLYFFSVTATLLLGRDLPIDEFLRLYVLHELILYSLYFAIIIRGAQRRPETEAPAVLNESSS